MKPFYSAIAANLAAVLLSSAAWAQTPTVYPTDPASGQPLAPVVAAAPIAPMGKVRGTITINGREIAYVSEAGETAVYNRAGSSLYTLTYDEGKAIDDQFRSTFGYRSPSPYVRYSDEANTGWRRNKVQRGPTSIPLMFKAQMAANPKLRLHAMGGYFDTTIPFLAALSDYEAADLPADRLTYNLYASGHAVFSDEGAQSIAAKRLRAFFSKQP